MNKHNSIENFVAEQNKNKMLFTAGPASLLCENITGLRPCFGRGDDDYTAVENRVLDALKKMTGHDYIVRMQGSSSLSIEIMILNFLFGKVLVVSTGYYSDRLKWLVESAKNRTGAISEIQQVPWTEIESITGNYDWVLACYTETSCGLKLPIESLAGLKERLGAQLMLDATASIGLESRHDLADVIAFSSCKGLFGLTGASFISSHKSATVKVDSFYLDINNHIKKLMTGPYHSICSLLDVLSRYEDFRAAVVENKKIFLSRMQEYITMPISHQPLLCTHVSCKIESHDSRSVLYTPRSNLGGSVVCHIGEVHLKRTAKAKILDFLKV